MSGTRVRRVIVSIAVACAAALCMCGPVAARAPRPSSLPSIPSACLTKNYPDASGDAEFDVLNVEMQYSCLGDGWRFDATLAPVSDWTTFGNVSLSLDTDANTHDGCDGFDYLIKGTIDRTNGFEWVTRMYRTPDCGTSVAVPTDASFVAINNDLEIYFGVTNLGDPTQITWQASVSNLAGNSVDFTPDSGPAVISGYPTLHDSYWEVDSRGHVRSFGAIESHGDLSAHPPAAPIVGMARVPDAGGYWLLGRDGGVFSYGDARFYGSTGNIHLNQPIVGMTPTPTGHGYWFVASDGGIFSFGDAKFHGSPASLHVAAPIVGMRSSESGLGYRVVTNSGAIYDFGDAFHYPVGPQSGAPFSAPVVAIG